MQEEEKPKLKTYLLDLVDNMVKKEDAEKEKKLFEGLEQEEEEQEEEENKPKTLLDWLKEYMGQKDKEAKHKLVELLGEQ